MTNAEPFAPRLKTLEDATTCGGASVAFESRERETIRSGALALLILRDYRRRARTGCRTRGTPLPNCRPGQRCRPTSRTSHTTRRSVVPDRTAPLRARAGGIPDDLSAYARRAAGKHGGRSDAGDEPSQNAPPTVSCSGGQKDHTKTIYGAGVRARPPPNGLGRRPTAPAAESPVPILTDYGPFRYFCNRTITVTYHRPRRPSRSPALPPRS